jgi:hypothetical protein
VILTAKQGGQVATDVFCGGSGGDFPSNEPVTVKDVKKNGESSLYAQLDSIPQMLTIPVVAIITFGDPSHVANVSYNIGDSINDGVSPQNKVAVSCFSTLTPYTDFPA